MGCFLIRTTQRARGSVASDLYRVFEMQVYSASPMRLYVKVGVARTVWIADEVVVRQLQRDLRPTL